MGVAGQPQSTSLGTSQGPRQAIYGDSGLTTKDDVAPSATNKKKQPDSLTGEELLQTLRSYFGDVAPGAKSELDFRQLARQGQKKGIKELFARLELFDGVALAVVSRPCPR